LREGRRVLLKVWDKRPLSLHLPYLCPVLPWNYGQSPGKLATGMYRRMDVVTN
jgi:hypothetical protein